MIDGFKTSCLPLNVYQLAETLSINIDPQTVYAKVSSLIFGFIDRVDTSTGEIRKVCTLHGSLHKYANGGVHNADSFRLFDLRRVFTEFKEVYGIDPNITRLQNVEFGVNIKLPYDPRRVLKAIRTYKGKTFVPMGEHGIEYKTKEYKIKIYDKGRQCGVPGFENVLRIEVRAIVSYLKKQGVYVPLLGDLLSVTVWQQLERLLIETLEGIVIVEAIPLERLSKKEQTLLALFLGDGWQSLNRNVLHKKKKQFIELAGRTGASLIKEELKNLVSMKCRELREIGDIEDIFSNPKSDGEINISNKHSTSDTTKQATLRTFLEGSEKRCFGDIAAVKIKSLNVANYTPETPPPESSNTSPLFATKKYDTDSNEGKCRGKPPDLKGFDTG
ncbi:hypothetical protein [uncultured Bacteroides sp.]|uniref:hypothetical protein n=1 Tax=uncultured Bacteroides sp. TaxID=162156 RepID=UPI0026119668|nr:hypothetical protein [uncultured Bacteroides sp.]